MLGEETGAEGERKTPLLALPVLPCRKKREGEIYVLSFFQQDGCEKAFHTFVSLAASVTPPLLLSALMFPDTLSEDPDCGVP